jgi:hypothetical protein
MPPDADVRTLRRAFQLLLGQVEPVVASKALRLAIGVLVAEDPHRPALQARQPDRLGEIGPVTNGAVAAPPTNGVAPASMPASEWEALRIRLHAIVLAASSERRSGIARELKISNSHLKNCISTTVPSETVIGRIADWLASHDDGSGPGVEARRAPARNGSAKPYRLPVELRSRLTLLLEHDPASVRQSAGVGIEGAKIAAAGGDLAPETIGRLVEFLEAGASSRL